MNTTEIVRAWKDEDYRDTLTAERGAELPQHPAGAIEFEQPELEDETLFRGGKISHGCHTLKCTASGNCK
jgi:mersacidin/lichenicidin family type 2 lantibiotic